MSKVIRPRFTKKEIEFFMYLANRTVKDIQVLRRQRDYARGKIRRLSRDIGNGLISINKVHEIKFYRHMLEEYNKIQVSDLFMEEDLLIACEELRDRFESILSGKQMKRAAFESSNSYVRFTIKEMSPEEWAKHIE